MRKPPLILVPILGLILVAYLYAKKDGDSTGGPSQALTESPSKTTGARKEVPSPESPQTAQTVSAHNRTHQVKEISETGLILVVDKTVDPVNLKNALANLGAQITPSSSGRTGSEIHFPEGVTSQEAQKGLAAAGLNAAGQLMRFQFQSAHTHSSCGSCLMPNYLALSELSGVLQVPLFLGDKQNELIDVVIDPEKTSSQAIINALQTDHSPRS